MIQSCLIVSINLCLRNLQAMHHVIEADTTNGCFKNEKPETLKEVK